MGFSIASSLLVMRTAIADIAHFGWVWRHEAVGATLDKFSSVRGIRSMSPSLVVDIIKYQFDVAPIQARG